MTKQIGLDRILKIEWLDATAYWVNSGLPKAEIRQKLDKLLEGFLANTGKRGSRDKTMTALMRVWVNVPDHLEPLRNDGLRLLDTLSPKQKVAVHWGMCMAVYPFFRDVATVTGRLLSVQGNAVMAQIIRRMVESWGERSTLIRATQRIVRTFVNFGILQETDKKGVYKPASKIIISDSKELTVWLVESYIRSNGTNMKALQEILTHPALFPFEIKFSAWDIPKDSRIEIQRHGLDESMVVVR
jgi:hypothetical protein